MASQRELLSGPSPSAIQNNTQQTLVDKVKSELCEDWLQQGIDSWGPRKREDNMPPSWTGAITTKIGTVFHYITCPGHLNGHPCAGCWSRRDRETAALGLHCVYGGWVSFNGHVITDVQPNPDDGAAPTGRNLPRLRRLWAEHVLSLTSTSQETSTHDNPAGIWDQAMVDHVHQLLDNTIAERTKKLADPSHTGPDKEKMLGKGSGGWSAVTENGHVLKRDTGNRRPAKYMDRTDKEPGGMWRRGDVEVWMTWNGWSCFVSRDGRWRPGYHLEILLCNWLTAIDYGLTRAVHRDWQANWLRATEWALVHTPLDVHRRFAKVLSGDALEMIRREEGRALIQKFEDYIPDDASTRALRYRSLHDRGGEAIAYHTTGEGLETPRGLVATWTMAVLNDIVDYERDVLCGESNNIARSLTSDQQVVDAAAWVLQALCWSTDNFDHDLTESILGSAALYLVMWRYNGPKLARYEAIDIRNRRPGRPPEIIDVAEIVRPHKTEIVDELPLYGELFDSIDQRLRKLYGGCTCFGLPEGHDAWELLAQAMDKRGDDDIEERLQVALVALNNGANEGDLRCECGVDLLLYECFVRTLHPETGIVARVHYRSGTELGNTVTE